MIDKLKDLQEDIEGLIISHEEWLDNDWRYAENHEDEYRDKLEMLYLFKGMIEERR